MSIFVSLAKLYVRLVFREGEYNAEKTQREFTVPDPPRFMARRCTPVNEVPVRAFWVDKQNAASGVLVYLHGGAFYFGPVKEHWEYLSRICRMTGMAGIMVDYGVAPQRPFPVGMDEILSLVRGIDFPAKWFFLGDSSGAAMAVSTVFRLKETGEKIPSKIVLMSPWIDVTLMNPDIEKKRGDDVMMTPERLGAAARDYVGNNDPADPLISPIFGDLTALPPVLIQMGTADLLYPDCIRFRDKCIDAGVDLKYEEYPDCFHDFMMLSILPEARRALRSQVEFLMS